VQLRSLAGWLAGSVSKNRSDIGSPPTHPPTTRTASEAKTRQSGGGDAKNEWLA